ncbi:MAG: hypothetical protein HQK76_15025 [Desulfobacterales bacterium]|nr:hypothetical protein [Desulfobacterales bacterium]
MLPGGKGEIIISVNTEGSGGHRLTKKISIESNDKKNPTVEITITGMVEEFVTIIPSKLQLTGQVNTELKTVAKIQTLENHPFNILEVSTRTGENIIYKLDPMDGSKPQTYILTVENVKKTPGSYFDVISIKTDNKLKPEIQIKVFGNILEEKQDNKESK